VIVRYQIETPFSHWCEMEASLTHATEKSCDDLQQAASVHQYWLPIVLLADSKGVGSPSVG
jgi:hypothetical protein